MIVPIGLHGTSRTVSSLPANGVTVYARLYSKIAGAWKYIDYTYTESGTATPPALATLISPAPGSVLGTSSTTFTWTPGSQVWDYQLNLGTRGPGSSDLIAPIGQQTTSRTVPSLPPNGVTVYARLYSKIAGVWLFNDYTFTESGTAVPPALAPGPDRRCCGGINGACGGHQRSEGAGPGEEHYSWQLGTILGTAHN